MQVLGYIKVRWAPSLFSYFLEGVGPDPAFEVTSNTSAVQLRKCVDWGAGDITYKPIGPGVARDSYICTVLCVPKVLSWIHLVPTPPSASWKRIFTSMSCRNENKHNVWPTGTDQSHWLIKGGAESGTVCRMEAACLALGDADAAIDQTPPDTSNRETEHSQRWVYFT